MVWMMRMSCSEIESEPSTTSTATSARSIAVVVRSEA